MKQLPQPDPRGILAATGLTPKQRLGEDMRLIADNDIWKKYNGPSLIRPEIPGVVLDTFYSQQDGRAFRCFVRRASATERQMLEQLGYTLPDDLFTAVTYRTESTRFRWWPQLEDWFKETKETKK